MRKLTYYNERVPINVLVIEEGKNSSRWNNYKNEGYVSPYIYTYEYMDILYILNEKQFLSTIDPSFEKQ